MSCAIPASQLSSYFFVTSNAAGNIRFCFHLSAVHTAHRKNILVHLKRTKIFYTEKCFADEKRAIYGSLSVYKSEGIDDTKEAILLQYIVQLVSLGVIAPFQEECFPYVMVRYTKHGAAPPHDSKLKMFQTIFVMCTTSLSLILVCFHSRIIHDFILVTTTSNSNPEQCSHANIYSTVAG